MIYLELSSSALILALIKGSIVLVVGVGVVASMRRCSASLRHAVLMGVLGAALIFPLISIALPKWSPIPLGATSVSGRIVGSSYSSMKGAPFKSVASQVPLTLGTISESVKEVGSSRTQWLNGLAGIWGLGLIYFLSRLGASFYLLRGLVRETAPVSDRKLLDALESCQEQLGISRRVGLRESSTNVGPFTCGVLRPLIVLPSTTGSWSLDRLRAVLLHELAHIQREDVASNIVARLSCSLYWFVPFAWFAHRRANLEREQACDDLVIRTGFDAPSYARHLLDLACGSKQGTSSFSPAVGMAQGVGLERRVALLLGDGVNRRRVSRLTLFALGLVLALICIPLAILADEPTKAIQNDDVPLPDKKEVPTQNEDFLMSDDAVLGVSRAEFSGDELIPDRGALVENPFLGGGGNGGGVGADDSVFSVGESSEEGYIGDLLGGESEKKVTEVFRLEWLAADEAADLVGSIFNVRVKANKSSNSLVCSGSREELDRVSSVLDDIEVSASKMKRGKPTILLDFDHDGDDDLVLGEGRSTSSKSGVVVRISEIGGVRASEEISIQATLVGNQVESVNLLVSVTCPYFKVAEMVEQLELAGISNVSVAVREKDE